MSFGERSSVRIRDAGRLRVRAQGPYGRELFYPLCEASRMFCSLLDQKSLTRRDVELIKALGYEVISVPSGTEEVL